MTTDELRAKFEAWWQLLLQTPYSANYNSQMPSEGDYRGIALLAYKAAYASRNDEFEAMRKDVERYRKLLDLLDEAEPVSNEASTIRNIIDDAINLGSGCLNLHLDDAMREGE